MAAYAYYEEDDPILSDSFYDDMVKTMIDRWSDIDHFHKEYISLDGLKAGTFMGKYPSRIKGALNNVREEKRKGARRKVG